MRIMPRYRKPLVILGILALMLSMVACEEYELDPTLEPSPPSVIPEATPTVTPTLQPFMAAVKATPTLTPVTPTPDAGSESYRVIFLLDNSTSLLDQCLTEEQGPVHSVTRHAMRDLTVFMVNILAQLSRRTPGADVQMGIYNLFAPNPRDQGDPDRHALLALQSVRDLRPGWEQRMVTSLETQVADLPGMDIGWLLPDEEEEDEKDSNQGSDRSAIITGAGNEMVVLITDGYTGHYSVPYPAPTVSPLATPTDTPDRIRKTYVEQLDTLIDVDSVSLTVLRFDCPGFLQDDISAYVSSIYQDDLTQWNSWDEDDFTQTSLDVSSPTGAAQSRLEAAQALLAPFEQSSLWPAKSQDGQDRAGWYDGSPITIELPANTVSLSMRLISGAANAASYYLDIERDGHIYRRSLSSTNPGHIYGLEREDHALREIIDEPSDTCGPISLQIKGATGPAVYWWESAPAGFSVEAIVQGAVVNNRDVLAAFRVNRVAPTQRTLSHLDCYTVRVSLRTAREPSGLIAQHEYSLRDLYPRMVGQHLFQGTGFNPEDHDGLIVTVELLQELYKEDGGSRFTKPKPSNQIAVAWADAEVESVFWPEFKEMRKTGPCAIGEPNCIELHFDFANSLYFDDPESGPQLHLYALSTAEKIPSGCVDFESTPGLTIKQYPVSPSSRDPEPKYLLARRIPSDTETEGTTHRSWTAKDNAQMLVVSVPLVNSETIESCGYSGILAQWGEENGAIPAILCVQGQEEDTVSCWPTETRVLVSEPAESEATGD